ncbi:hypothetical protein J0X19_09245 [Hymenobacter sp. BT186]|uniref:Uncharacterized protein n=1 Tax=Hymenobacter telluris TaxID=2816474 RepID=A0A939EVS7_9BACT|nr:hypothetical protein [Hymenobacter telluris]MBO0358127.1 hypothetical protein [Hymenobacter telluris]MBW3374154.1 hypothetical protein [Hymenobacter norwichensis]
MQKVFSFLEKSSVILAGIGLMFNLLLWKGGDFMLIISLTFLSVIYFFGSYFQRAMPVRHGQDITTTSATTALLKIFIGIAFSTMIVGLLFKLLFWKGSFVMLTASIVATACILLWALVTSKSLTKPSETAVFRRSGIILSLGIADLLISSSTIYGIFHRNDPQLVEKWTRMSQHPENAAYKADFDAYRRHQ